jgi:hypothetical protein
VKKRVFPKAVVIFLILFMANLPFARAQIVSTNSCMDGFNSGAYSKYTIAFGSLWKQTNAAGPVPETTNYYGFSASIVEATNLDATGATLYAPGQPSETMGKAGTYRFAFPFATNSFSNLVAAYPSGSYGLALTNESTIFITIPPISGVPNAPTLTSYDADQAIDPTKDFTLAWLPFTNGTKDDFITVNLTPHDGFSPSLKSEDFGCPGYLDGTATSVLIPANSLETNTTYSLEILFVTILVVDTNTSDFDFLLAGTETETDTTVATTAGSSSGGSFALTNVVSSANGTVQFSFQATPGVSYTIQFNQNLNDSANWSSLLTTNAASTAITFTNTLPQGVTSGFYRAYHN